MQAPLISCIATMSEVFVLDGAGPGRSPYNRRMLQQRTLKSITRAVGVGLHSGQKVEMTLRPAPPDTGIVFRRVDLPQPVDIPVNTTSVSDTRMASTISPGGDPGGPKVQTIEHLMSACAGLGVDNLVVDITADEVPILDGSSASFVFLLQSAGIALQDAPKRFLQGAQARRGAARRGRLAGLGAARAVPRLQADVRDRVQPSRRSTPPASR